MEVDSVRPLMKDITPKADIDGDIDMSEGMATEMFGIASSSEEVNYSFVLFSFKILLLIPNYSQTEMVEHDILKLESHNCLLVSSLGSWFV